MSFVNSVDLLLFVIISGLGYFVLLPELRKKQRINLGFWTASIPFLIITGITSSLAAHNHLNPATGILSVLSILYFLLRSRKKLEKGIQSFKEQIIIGITLATVFVLLSGTPGSSVILEAFLFTLIATSVPFIFFYFEISGSLKPGLAIGAHFLDAASTVIALKHSFKESRILASVFLETFGPSGIFLLKALIIIPVVYLAQEFEQEQREGLIYTIFCLGLVLGVRNIFLIS